MKANDHMRFADDAEETRPSSITTPAASRAGVASAPLQIPQGTARALPWILTLTGRAWYPDAPEEYAYDIREIATSLSREARFVGHTHAHLEGYSVAQHCVLVSRAVARRWGNMASPRLLRAALLHDAAEAFWKDLPAPLKRLPEMAGYCAGIARTESAIAAHFDLVLESLDTRIKVCDLALLATEKRDLLARCDGDWGVDLPPPLSGRIAPWSAEIAKLNFIAEWHRFGGAS